MKDLTLRRLDIELSGVCNLHCIWCPYDNKQKKYKKFMDYNLFLKILDDIGNRTPRLALMAYGEITLYPRVMEALQEIEKRGYHCHQIYTNGTNLSEEISRFIVRSPSVELIDLSIYGNSDESFNKHTNTKGLFAKVRDNMIRFSEIAADRNNFRYPTPKIIYNIVPEDDYEKTHEFWDYYKDRINYMREEILGDKYTKVPKGLSRRAMSPIMDMNNVSGNIARYKTKIHFCGPTQILSRAVVFPNGDVSFCCLDTFMRGKIGNVTEDNILDIFNSKIVKRYREDFLKGNCVDNPLCSTCEFSTFRPIPKKYRNLVI